MGNSRAMLKLGASASALVKKIAAVCPKIVTAWSPTFFNPRLCYSGGTSTEKEPSHLEVKKSSSQVRLLESQMLQSACLTSMTCSGMHNNVVD